VYNVNSNGPRTDPCGTPYETGRLCEVCPCTEKVKVRDDKYDDIHARAVFCNPNQLDRRYKSIV
jgi:hypothetical protein